MRDEADGVLGADDRSRDRASAGRPTAAARRRDHVPARRPDLDVHACASSSAPARPDRSTLRQSSQPTGRPRLEFDRGSPAARRAGRVVGGVQPFRPRSTRVAAVARPHPRPAGPDPRPGRVVPRRPARREDQPVGRACSSTRRARRPVLDTVIEAERRLAAAAGTKLYRPIDGEVALPRAGPGARARRRPRGRDVRARARDPDAGRDRRAARRGRPAAPTGGGQTIWMSEPTWPNHPTLFQAAGFRVRPYPYTDATGRRIDEDALLAALGERRARATSCCSTAPATTRRAWTRRPTCGGGSATSSRSGACCRSSTSPTRGSATASREDAAGLLELRPAGRRAARLDLVLARRSRCTPSGSGR